MITNEDFRNYCIGRRNELGLSVSRIAERMEIRWRTYDHFERGITNPSFAFAVRASRALGFSLDDLARQYYNKNQGNDPEIPFD